MSGTVDNMELLGVGLYSVPQAARLAGAPAKSVRRWLYGYRYRNQGQQIARPPIVQTELPDQIVTFRDLIELHFVNSFRAHGVSWDTIRKAADSARQITGSDHPFASHGFVTDGETIFAEVMCSVNRKELLDLKRNQMAFRKLLLPSLRARLDVGLHGAQRWWPLGKKRDVVIDPNRHLGQPITNKAGVPTAVLAQAYKTTRSYQTAAQWFEVSTAAVRSAVSFERRFADAA